MRHLKECITVKRERYEHIITKVTPMKITIRRQYLIGSCWGEERFVWVTEEVTPQELQRLINRRETIIVINNPYSENKR